YFLSYIFFPFSSQSSRDHPALHSFPTRRSSDLCVCSGHSVQLRTDFRAAKRSCFDPGRTRTKNRLHPGLRLSPDRAHPAKPQPRSEEHTSELQSRENLVCRLLLEKKKKNTMTNT